MLVVVALAFEATELSFELCKFVIRQHGYVLTPLKIASFSSHFLVFKR